MELKTPLCKNLIATEAALASVCYAVIFQKLFAGINKSKQYLIEMIFFSIKLCTSILLAFHLNCHVKNSESFHISYTCRKWIDFEK